MKQSSKNYLLFILFTFSSLTASYAATKNDPHLPISHCYHWLDQKNKSFLSYKYQYGDRNNGDVAFVAGTNGAIAGPGLYCAKSPSGSYGYGDRVIRLELVDDIVMLDATTGRKYCGHNGNFYSQSECNKKSWDIKFYTGGGRGNSAWYVIKDPQAIAKWSANSDQLITDLTTSKSLNSGGASTHFDLTIRAINRERSNMGGEKIYINQNARMSILKILTKPNLLRQVPALTVISKVADVPDSDFSKSKKSKVYKQQFFRALEDSFLSYDDFNSLVKSDKLVKKSFVNLIENLDSSLFAKINLPVVMLSLAEYSTLDVHQASQLWRHALSSNGPLQLLIDAKLDPNHSMAKAFASVIVEKKNQLDSVKAHNFLPLISLVNDFATHRPHRSTYTDITQKLFTKAIETNSNPVAVFKSFNNSLINKTSAIQKSLSGFYTNNFTGLDLITIGHLADLASLDTSTMTNYSNIINQMDIPASQKATYLIMDDFQKGTFTLPSMVTLTNYMSKLMKRALAERGQKGMTNTYRFVFSDIFHYFFSRIKAEKDDIKKAILINEASDFLYEFADNLPDPYFKSYSYILTQNASFFEMNLKYKEHPIKGAFDRYQTGDANFDAFFEEITKHALEGSYLQFLIEHADDQKAMDLLNIAIAHITSTEFDNWINSAEFQLSQEEKKDWKNMISNKKYARSGSFVSSDICRLSKVLYQKRKYLTKILDPAVDTNLKATNKALYKSVHCK